LVLLGSVENLFFDEVGYVFFGIGFPFFLETEGVALPAVDFQQRIFRLFQQSRAFGQP